MTDHDVALLRARIHRTRARKLRWMQVRAFVLWTALGIAAGWAVLGLGAEVWEWLR